MYVLLSLGYRPIPSPSPIPLFNYIGDREESNCVLYILLQLMSFSSLARGVRTKVRTTSEAMRVSGDAGEDRVHSGGVLVI